MRERSSPWLYQWTPDPESAGTGGAATLQAAPTKFGFWGTAASKQHPGACRSSGCSRCNGGEKHDQTLFALPMPCSQRS